MDRSFSGFKSLCPGLGIVIITADFRFVCSIISAQTGVDYV